MARKTTRRTATKKGGFAAAWAKSAEEAKKSNTFGEAIPVDKGKYIMQVVHASVQKTSNGNQLITKFCVICNDEFDGEICTKFQPIDDEEKLIFIQKDLVGLGVDVSEVDIDDDDLAGSLVAVYEELIEDCVCTKVQVVEKGDNKNMYLNTPTEPDDEDLVDPDEVLTGGKSEDGQDEEKPKRKGRKAKAEDEYEDEDEEEGEEEEGEEEGEEEDPSDITYADISVGDRVKAVFDDEEYEGEVKAKPTKLKKANQVEVLWDEEEDTEPTDVADIIEILDSDEEGEEGEEDEGFGIGDEVSFKIKRKTHKGVIKHLDDGQAKIKEDKVRKLHIIDVDKLTLVE